MKKRLAFIINEMNTILVLDITEKIKDTRYNMERCCN